MLAVAASAAIAGAVTMSPQRARTDLALVMVASWKSLSGSLSALLSRESSGLWIHDTAQRESGRQRTAARSRFACLLDVCGADGQPSSVLRAGGLAEEALRLREERVTARSGMLTVRNGRRFAGN